MKGGTDPAGALERYGAAKKSFENSLKEGLEVKTILLASCMTPEAKDRIAHDSIITKFYNLTEIIREQTQYNDLTSFIFALLDA